MMVDDGDGVHDGDHEINEPPWNLAQCMGEAICPLAKGAAYPRFFSVSLHFEKWLTEKWKRPQKTDLSNPFGALCANGFLFGSGCEIPSSRLDIFSGSHRSACKKNPKQLTKSCGWLGFQTESAPALSNTNNHCHPQSQDFPMTKQLWLEVASHLSCHLCFGFSWKES